MNPKVNNICLISILLFCVNCQLLLFINQSPDDSELIVKTLEKHLLISSYFPKFLEADNIIVNISMVELIIQPLNNCKISKLINDTHSDLSCNNPAHYKKKFVTRNACEKKVLIEKSKSKYQKFCPRKSLGSFTDSRDGKKYKTVRIGRQIWMAENLGYTTDSSWCYNDDTVNCTKYGRLYNWQAASGACPIGWRLPNETDLVTLLDNVGGDGFHAFQALREGGQSGFNAKGGGYRESEKDYNDLDSVSRFWSCTLDSEIGARVLHFDIGYREANISSDYHYMGYSVRCIKE